MILALEKKHQNLHQKLWAQMFQFDQIKKLLNKFDKQAKPDFKKLAKSHSNAFPDNVIIGSKRVFNLSVHNMKGHITTPLKISKSNFLRDLTSDMELGNKTPTFKLLGVIMEDISEGTIISFLAVCIDLEVCVDPVFLANKQSFDTCIVEVFGSYESVYEHLKTKDKEVKEAAAKVAAALKVENKK
ncbi:hypothetical protein HDU80_008250 [Chytriomyces hyalinus]|nr:hypothetical protein HDU80_008250 [Chytriomyces hyalinus]